ADAVAVLRAGDTGVVAGAADAAVASRALRIAGVALAVADELVRARPEVGDHRDREAVGDVDEVPRGPGRDFDRRGAGQAADRLPVALGETASRGVGPGH